MTRDDLEKIGGNAYLADTLGLNRSTVAMWWSRSKTRHARIPYKHAKKIAEMPEVIKLGFTLEYIMGEE